MEDLERADVMIARMKQMPRERVKEYIRLGKVFLDGKKVTKASLKVSPHAEIEIQAEVKYVGRGGYKLEKAIDFFNLSPANQVCMDVGASTGGFSDCLLQHNGKKIYAIDVGHSQLAEKIAMDDRVISMEKTNIKNVTPDLIEPIDFVCVDVSFISLTKVLTPIAQLMKANADIICLVKPQFEAGKANVTRTGIVKNPKVHLKVLQEVTQYAVEIGFSIQGATFSDIKGSDGNIEYLLYMKKNKEGQTSILWKELVQRAYETLGRV